MSFLNDLFHVFDGLCDQYNVYKVETIGDCYVATVGLVTGNMLSKKLYASDLTLQDFMRDNKEARNYLKEKVEDHLDQSYFYLAQASPKVADEMLKMILDPKMTPK